MQKGGGGRERGKKESVQLPELVVVLGDANAAAFGQSKDGGQKGGGERERT